MTKLYPTGKFAKLARVSHATLRYYDKIGLFSPDSYGANDYRYYSIRKLPVIKMIQTMQALGMSLTDIQTAVKRRTPEYVAELLARQMGEIDKKMRNLSEARNIMLLIQETILASVGLDEDAVTVQFLPEATMILGEVCDYSKGKHAYDALLDFYHTVNVQYPEVDLNYPVWGMFTEERIRREDWNGPERYYFYHPAGRDKRPASLYVIGHTRGSYGQSDSLYRKLMAYIDANGLECCGDAYEEYPLNEVCISDDTQYLMRIMITVREKK